MVQWGLSLRTVGDIRVMSNKSTIFSNADSGETSYSGNVGSDSGQRINYTISNEEGRVSIIVDGIEYSSNQKGIHVVVINNNYRIVVDSLTITCEDGHLAIKR